MKAKLRYFNYEQMTYFTTNIKLSIKEIKAIYRELKNATFNNNGIQELKFGQFKVL